MPKPKDVKLIIFNNNGTTVALDKFNEQIPELQVPYFKLFCDYLESKGIKPEGTIMMVGYRGYKIIKTENGFSWKAFNI